MAQLDVTRDLLLKKISWDWQPLEPIVQALIPTVAPGLALRTYEKRAEAGRASGRRKDVGNRGAQTKDEQINSGARQIVNTRLRSLVESGRVIVDEVDGAKSIKFFDRRAAGKEQATCPTCSNPRMAPAKRPQTTERRKSDAVVYPVIPAWQKVAEENLHASM